MVRPPLITFLGGGFLLVTGLGISANGAWGRTDEGGDLPFGFVFTLVGIVILVLAARPWITVDDAGLRVGSLRRVRVPWSDLRGLAMRDVSEKGIRLPSIRVERRGQRTLTLVPAFSYRSYRQVAELRYVAKRIAVEAERRGVGPVPWPEHLVYVEVDGTRSAVR